VTFERLGSTPYKKVWGSALTAPWFENPNREAIGEVWFEDSGAAELLVKFLFTAGKLSVQVHPNDDQARAAGFPRGKTEMWHVVHAEPGAQVALGLNRTVTADELRAACESGAVAGWLNWIPAHAGDTFLVSAGTVHAIGSGLVLCEVQQHCDITYRLYDFGRGRELHLDEGIPISLLDAWQPHGAVDAPVIAQCDYFRTERLEIRGILERPPVPKNTLYIAIHGEGRIAGHPFQAGDAFEAGAGFGPALIESPNAVVLAAAKP
jgi:mannose-6-phosphate isomerase